jgi:hypothetical protein
MLQSGGVLPCTGNLVETLACSKRQTPQSFSSSSAYMPYLWRPVLIITLEAIVIWP